MKGVTNSVFYLLYIQENCVRAYRGEGDPGPCVRTAYRGGGERGGQKLAISCVRTLWMAPCLLDCVLDHVLECALDFILSYVN